MSSVLSLNIQFILKKRETAYEAATKSEDLGDAPVEKLFHELID